MKCKEKERFITKAYAKKVKKMSERKYWVKLTVYKCQECGMFHFYSGGLEKKDYFRNVKFKNV